MRRRVEGALRVAAFALLAWALWRALQPTTRGTRTVTAAQLEQHPDQAASINHDMHVMVGSAVSPRVRDALGAARRAGLAVTWSGDSAAYAATAVAAREPGGAVEVRAAGMGAVRSGGTGTGTGVLVDTLGVVDSLAMMDGGAVASLVPGRALRFTAPATNIPLTATPDTAPRRALIVGRAGWEAKFAMAALEERGWEVSARLAVAPGADVSQGALPTLDPAKLDVIVVLDTSRAGPDAAAIARFVRAGGGLVLIGEGVLAHAALAPARAGALTRAPRSDAVVTRESLSYRPLSSLRADAVVLERRDNTVVSAARADRLGRVVQVGTDDSWRWRMEGNASSVEGHRAWWSRLLASAAPDRVPAAPSGEGAPRARLVAALGAPVPAPAAPGGNDERGWLWPAIALLLIAEWASRRTRGAA